METIEYLENEKFSKPVYNVWGSLSWGVFGRSTCILCWLPMSRTPRGAPSFQFSQCDEGEKETKMETKIQSHKLQKHNVTDRYQYFISRPPSARIIWHVFLAPSNMFACSANSSDMYAVQGMLGMRCQKILVESHGMRPVSESTYSQHSVQATLLSESSLTHPLLAMYLLAGEGLVDNDWFVWLILGSYMLRSTYSSSAAMTVIVHRQTLGGRRRSVPTTYVVDWNSNKCRCFRYAALFFAGRVYDHVTSTVFTFHLARRRCSRCESDIMITSSVDITAAYNDNVFVQPYNGGRE
ncbi:hypothetical protein ACRALDRAFT_208501 [Sodiomyces alcalophilus JCM 7366]|uniref:uncharacterized protein n=1 Tax=Sodiomyces alcalophilus JCM 7366 TaxID=591952 RepID=UPI0039B5D920